MAVQQNKKSPSKRGMHRAHDFLTAPALAVEPSTGEGYARDPRMIAKRAEAYMKQTKVGDTVYVGPEAEFFIFDDVRFASSPYNTGYKLDSIELPTNTDTVYETGNMGHRMRTKGGYFPMNPMDSAQDMRSEMLSVMGEMGVSVEKHHHEVAAAQHELGMKYDTLTTMADQMQIYKYVIHNVAHAYGKTATFMPKPVITARACIANKIHPGEAMDKNLYDLPPAELKQVPTVCGSLGEALAALDKDRDFLKKGGVFTDDQIDSYIELKMEENMRTEMTPHPVEFDMYYSC